MLLSCAYMFKQRLALVFAMLCHDVDHRGLSNTFLQKYNEPLSVLYDSSILENHHWSIISKLLQVSRSSSLVDHQQMVDHAGKLSIIAQSYSG